MVISIDAVRRGTELDGVESWRTAIAESVTQDQSQQSAELVAPARGIVCGLLLSVALWVGLLAAARAVLLALR